MSTQERKKLKEKAPNKFDKEGIGSRSIFLSFRKGAWQWRRYLVKIRRKYKAREAKNCHDNNVRGEIVFKFPLIDDRGGNKFVSARTTCYSANSWKLQDDDFNNSKRGSQESRKKLSFCENL